LLDPSARGRSSIYTSENRVEHGQVRDHVGHEAALSHAAKRLQIYERGITHVNARRPGGIARDD